MTAIIILIYTCDPIHAPHYPDTVKFQPLIKITLAMSSQNPDHDVYFDACISYTNRVTLYKTLEEENIKMHSS